MKTEDQRIAIAEACGWRWMTRKGDRSSWLFAPNEPQLRDRMGTVSGFEFVPEIEGSNRWGAGSKHFPDYLSDLNAMHEAEKVLTDEQRRRYEAILIRVIGGKTKADGAVEMFDFDLLHATAAQRAEAFLRTLGLWKEAA